MQIFIITVAVIVSADLKRQRRSAHNSAMVPGALADSIVVAGPVAPAATVVAPLASPGLVGLVSSSAAVICRANCWPCSCNWVRC